METSSFDVIVIGSGGGLKIARPAARLGLRVAVVEESACGGTCLNRGCIPSKMLVYPAEFTDKIRAAHRLNIVVPEPRVEFGALVSRITQTVDPMSQQLRQACARQPNLEWIEGHARFTEGRSIRVGSRDLHGERIFIATGSRPTIPDIAGLASTPYMTGEQALRRTEPPQHLLVLGGGYIAVELGNAYRALGCRTTFLVRSRLLRHEDREIGDAFTAAFRRRNTVLDCFQTESVEHDGRLFTIRGQDGAGQRHVVQGDALLVANGVTPCTDRLGLENTAVRRTPAGHIEVDEFLRTAEPGVYALGDAVGHYLFRHTVNREGEYLMRSVFGGQTALPLDYGPVPHAVFGDPEIAGVGLTEEEVRQRGLDYVVGRAAYADSNQGLARRLECGLCKILVDRATRGLLGAHLLGEEASNMIHMLILLMKMNGTLDDLLDMIFIHPALPEIVRDAARDAQTRMQA